MEEKDAGNEIALTRRKTVRSVLRIFVTLQVKERPSGDRRIGFPERTVNCVVARFLPVEYLTYEIRDVSDIERLVGADALV